MKTEEIKKLLDDVESYSPTIPLSYDKYHSIIRDLIEPIKGNRVELEKFRELLALIERIDKIPLDQLELYENGQKIDIPDSIIKDWKFTGLSNHFLLEMWPIDVKDFEAIHASVV